MGKITSLYHLYAKFHFSPYSYAHSRDVFIQLSLEDWFYVGDNGAVEVASPEDAVAAACLPPLHLDSSTGPRWNSETGELINCYLFPFALTAVQF